MHLTRAHPICFPCHQHNARLNLPAMCHRPECANTDSSKVDERNPVWIGCGVHLRPVSARMSVRDTLELRMRPLSEASPFPHGCCRIEPEVKVLFESYQDSGLTCTHNDTLDQSLPWHPTDQALLCHTLRRDTPNYPDFYYRNTLQSQQMVPSCVCFFMKKTKEKKLINSKVSSIKEKIGLY